MFSVNMVSQQQLQKELINVGKKDQFLFQCMIILVRIFLVLFLIFFIINLVLRGSIIACRLFLKIFNKWSGKLDK